MQRLYFLVSGPFDPNPLVNALRAGGIRGWQIQLWSQQDSGRYERHMLSDELMRPMEMIRHAERGAAIGLLLGLVAAVWLLAEEPFAAGGGLVYAAIFGFVTLLGGWIGGLTGLASEKQQVAAFRADIEAGRSLLLIDIDVADASSVIEGLIRQDARVRYVRTDAILPPLCGRGPSGR